MLLSYKKTVKASARVGSFGPGQVKDESVKTFWVAEKNNVYLWLETDLQTAGRVYAIQGSLDGRNRIRLVDRSENVKEVSWMVYSETSLELRALSPGQSYYIAIEALMKTVHPSKQHS